MNDEEKEEISPKMETLNPKDEEMFENLNIEQTVKEVPKKTKGCYFPSAHAILLILEIIVFILTYIIPKGKYDCIKYQEDIDKFTVITYDQKGKRYEKCLELMNVMAEADVMTALSVQDGEPQYLMLPRNSPYKTLIEQFTLYSELEKLANNEKNHVILTQNEQ